MFHGDLLGERARITPGREALVVLAAGEGEPDRYTYAQLDDFADRAARLLVHDLGLRKGDRFGLLTSNCREFLDLFFAAGKSGVIVVPLSTRATAHELTGIARDCAMRGLVFGPEFEAVAAQVAEACGFQFLLPLEEYARLQEAADRHPPLSHRGAPEDVYCLLYTSGTTGKPKGVMVPNRMVCWNGYNTAINWDLREDDRSSIYTPLYHAGGTGAFLLPIFAAGGTIVLHRRFDVSEVWRVIAEERCTVVLGVPTIFKMLMEAPEFRTAQLPHVRWFISGGAPLPVYIIEAFQQRGIPFKQGFGLTEVGVNCFTMTLEDSYRKAGSIGRPLMFTEARLCDEEGVEVAQGEVGELYLRGPHVSSGYWNNPEATAQSYLPGGWFRTGDSARRDEEGFFYIAGRKKEMFISGGVNVYPAEIEGQLLTHPSVADAAVLGVADEKWGEVGVAFVVVAPGAAPDEAPLVAWLLERLGKLKLPRRFLFVEALPRTPYGKVMKEELRKRL